MNRKVVIIQDFFLNEIHGGAELFTDVLISKLKQKGHEVETIKSQNVQIENLNKENVYIVSNFKMLTEANKKYFINNLEYIIIEHDHHYCKKNNPVLYKNLIVDEQDLINQEFYEKAKGVCCQSQLHAETVYRNLLLNNIHNLRCNLWNDEQLALLESNLDKKKTRKYGILETQNKNKGMSQAIAYCRKNNINFELIPFCNQKQFYEELAKTETLVFFPTWMESFSRVAVEAKILGCKLITNKALGVASEEWFQKYKGKELLDYIKGEGLGYSLNIIGCLLMKDYDKRDIGGNIHMNLPKVSVMTTIFKAGKYIEGYLDSFINQTYQNKELIIIDANSPDNEKEIIERYQQKFDNIKYIRLDETVKPSVAFNIATKHLTGDFVSCVLVDDRIDKNYIKTLAKHLLNNENIDLVYGDALQTTKANESMENNSSRGRIYEHSKMEFSPENMIKCLPGPFPMFRLSFYEKYGNWNEKLKYACDWELWLKAVRNGAKFKKINKVIGLYFFNPAGLSTSQEHMKERRIEERDVFNEYKDVFGERNYSLFKEYFNSI